MAPGRKKGANKTKSAAEMSLGDLVLAKVKGFPAWPAKVSRPEDWERDHDPRKYFVQFFGTQEIAFVAPADVQAFTSESKSKLLARCKGKTVKYFGQAVKEICEAFEQLQNNDLDSSKNSDMTDSQHYGSDAEGDQFKGPHAELSKVHDGKRLNWSDRNDSMLLRDSCSAEILRHKHDKQVAIPKESGEFPDRQTVKKFVQDAVHDESVSSIKEKTNCTDNKAEYIKLSRASSSSPHSCHYDFESDINLLKATEKDNTKSLEVSGHLKVPSAGNKKAVNGQMSKVVNVGSKRKIDDDKSCAVNGQKLSLGILKSELNSSAKAIKKQIKSPNIGKKLPNDVAARPKDHGNGDNFKQKAGAFGQEQPPHLAKKAKHVDMISDTSKASVIKVGKDNLDSGSCNEEIALLAKRSRRALEAMPDAILPTEDKRLFGSSSYKNDGPKKRRAVRLSDDEDKPKTPVHGRSFSSSKFYPGINPESSKVIDESPDVSSSHTGNLKSSSRSVSDSKKDHLPSASSIGESFMASTIQEKIDNSIKQEPSRSPGIEDLDNKSLKGSSLDLVSPSKSPFNKLLDQQKGNRPSIKGSNTGSGSKIHSGSSKGPHLVSGTPNSSQSQSSGRKGKQLLSGERSKSTPKMRARNEGAASLDIQRDQYSMQGGSNRLEDDKDRSGSLVDPKAGESSTSMRHLIAAAQAKRREAQVQNVPLGDGNSVSVPTNILRGRSASPSSAEKLFQKAVVENVTQLDAIGVHSRGSLSSPSGQKLHFASENLLNSKELEEKGLSSTHCAAALSGGTEAAVSRDAFEGMIETLSRTKDSIGRATRLAIDCAKYGIANEVVDLLIRKLENEPSFHRRVDLFFLVDSITQCSHSQKGIAGASYIPIVQAALPRLLGAAAPSGANARENRRQCLKVLRLWLERKIFTESVLRRHMDGIGGSNDDGGGGLSLKRPSRAERSVDDPIREMEGMLVDEYGSNATFNLPGFLQSHGFVEEDEDDVPTTTTGKESDASLLELPNNSAGSEAGKVTPIDRTHHILEDVDGELEMEDVSGHGKDDTLSPSGSLGKEKQDIDLDAKLESLTDNLAEPLSPGSPPLPLEPPPPLPPLPSSPPPPPPLSPSLPPPPPPPFSTLQPPPPPLPSPSMVSHLPPPPSLASLPHLPPSLAPQQPQPLPSLELQPPLLLPPGPPQPSNFQPLLPPQPSGSLQVQSKPQPPAVHPPLQGLFPPDYSIPNGTQPAHMNGNTLHQVPCFAPAGASGSHDPSGYSSRSLEYGQSDMYPGPHTGQSNKQFQGQQFQPSQTVFAQRPFPPVSVPQNPSNNFTYNKATFQQHIPHSHPPPPLHPPPPPPPHIYSSASQVQWRSSTADYKVDNQSSMWVNGGRTPGGPSTNFAGEAYFRPLERIPSNSMGYQASTPNPAFPGPSTPVPAAVWNLPK